MQRYDGEPSEITVFYDTNFGSCISGGTTKEVHTKAVEAQSTLCGGGWI